MNPHPHRHFRPPFASWRTRCAVLSVLAIVTGLLPSLPRGTVFAASSWSPTLLVNTEAFQVIDDTDSANLEIWFGGTLREKLYYNRNSNRFQFTRSLYVGGAITATGSISAKGTLSGAALNVMAGNSYLLGNVGIGTSATPDATLEVVGTGSGRVIYAEKELRSSGTLIVTGDTRIDGGTFFANTSLNRIGVNTVSPKTAFETIGQMSGSSLNVSYAFSGAGLTSCSDGTNSKLLWSTSGRFSCGTDQGGGGGISQAQGDARYVNTSGDTMTGLLVINLSSGTIGLSIKQVGSGATLHAENQLRSSGTLAVEGTARFDGNLTFGDAISDALTINAGTWTFANDTNFALSGGQNGLSFDTSTFSVDANAHRIGIGTTTPGSKLALSGTLILDARGNLGASAADSGLAAEIVGTLSGRILHAETQLRSSGTLIVTGDTRIDGGTFFANTSLNRIGVNTVSPKTAFETIGQMSGSSLNVSYAFSGAGLTSCSDGTNSKLLWSTSGRFSCGTDQGGGGGISQAQGDARYVNTSGDTMTGILLFRPTAGVNTVALNVAATMSGRSLTVTGTGTNVPLLVTNIANGGVAVRKSTAKANLDVLGSISGSTLTISNLRSCSIIGTNASGAFSCGGMVVKNKSTNTTVNNSIALVEEMSFTMAANETWVFRYDMRVHAASATPGFRWAIGAPAAATCSYSLADLDTALSGTGTAICNKSMRTTMTANNKTMVLIYGSIANGANAGSGVLRWAQWVANASNNIVASGSSLIAFKTVGSDLAEVYQSRDASVMPGTVVSIDSTMTAGVKMSTQTYDPHLLGVVSTKPGITIGGDDLRLLFGKPVFVALAGRVPVMVNNENGPIKVGDYLTSSSTPGVAMRASKAGPVIGQALTAFDSSNTGVVTVFIRSGFVPQELFAPPPPTPVAGDLPRTQRERTSRR